MFCVVYSDLQSGFGSDVKKIMFDHYDFHLIELPEIKELLGLFKESIPTGSFTVKDCDCDFHIDNKAGIIFFHGTIHTELQNR